MLLRRAQIALAVLALVIAVAVGLAAGATVQAGDPVPVGALAGIGTLVTCWTLLAVAGAVWRSRLTARDSRDWAAEWARVESLWSQSSD